MNEKLTGENFFTLAIDPQGVRKGSFKTSIKAPVIAGLPTMLGHYASECGVDLVIEEKSYQYLIWQTVAFKVSGEERKLHDFQQCLKAKFNF